MSYIAHVPRDHHHHTCQHPTRRRHVAQEGEEDLLSRRGGHGRPECLDDPRHALLLGPLIPAMLVRVAEQEAQEEGVDPPRVVGTKRMLHLRARPLGRGAVLDPLHEVAQVSEADIFEEALSQEGDQGGGAVVVHTRAGLIDSRDGVLRFALVAIVGHPIRLGAR